MSNNVVQSILSTSEDTNSHNRIFIKGLNKKSSRESILSALSKYGEVSYFRLPFCVRINKNIGHAHIAFKDPSVASGLLRGSRAILIDGRICEVLPYQKVKKQKVGKDRAAKNISMSNYENGEPKKTNIWNSLKSSKQPSNPQEGLKGINLSSFQRRNTQILSRDKHVIKPTKKSYRNPFTNGIKIRDTKDNEYRYNLNLGNLSY